METKPTHLTDLFKQAEGKPDGSALPEFASLEQVARLLAIDPDTWSPRPDVAQEFGSLLWSPRFKPLHETVGQKPKSQPLPLLFTFRVGAPTMQSESNTAQAKAKAQATSQEFEDLTGLCLRNLKPFRALLKQKGAAPDALDFLLGPETLPAAENSPPAANLSASARVSHTPAKFSPTAVEICSAAGFSGSESETCAKAALLSRLTPQFTKHGFSDVDVQRVFANLDKQPALKHSRGLYFALPVVEHLLQTLPVRTPNPPPVLTLAAPIRR